METSGNVSCGICKEEREKEIAHLKYSIGADLRALEARIGTEATKDFIKDYPLPF